MGMRIMEGNEGWEEGGSEDWKKMRDGTGRREKRRMMV